MSYDNHTMAGPLCYCDFCEKIIDKNNSYGMICNSGNELDTVYVGQCSKSICSSCVEKIYKHIHSESDD